MSTTAVPALEGTQPPSGPRERTRRLLVETARDQLRTGGPLTVQAVAQAAGVSRATAYRYFPSNESVVLHATLPLGDDPLEEAGWDPAVRSDPAELPARAAELVRVTGRWAFEHQVELRRVLHLSLAPGDSAFSRRPLTSRSRWIGALLEALPDHVPEPARRRLAAALMPLFGADAVVWSTDMAELDPTEAIEVMAWMASVLVEATITRSGGG